MDLRTLTKLLYDMYRIRMVEEKIVELYPEQEMRCPVHLCIGQEAVAAGVCAALSPDDYAMSAHRSHGHYLARGGDLKAMLAELYGRDTGCCRGKGGSMHLIDIRAGFLGAVPIVGSTIPIAVGVALGCVMRGEARVVAVFFGEAATEEGVFHESMNFAVLKNLPIVFVCENNQFSVYSPMSVRQPSGRSVAQLAGGHGVETHEADGNDAGAVYQLTQHAVHRAIHGNGPIFLEFPTYRWREHCGPNYDNDLGYRDAREFESWKQRCPIDRLTQSMLKEGMLTESALAAMKQEIEEEIEAAVAFAKQSAFPQECDLLTHVYAP